MSVAGMAAVCVTALLLGCFLAALCGLWWPLLDNCRSAHDRRRARRARRHRAGLVPPFHGRARR